MSTEAQEHSKIEQLQHASPDEIEVAAGREREDLQGWVPTLASDQEILDALEKAFDYRGDITITRKDGSTIEGTFSIAGSVQLSPRLKCACCCRVHRKRFLFLTVRSQAWLSVDETRPRARASTPG